MTETVHVHLRESDGATVSASARCASPGEGIWGCPEDPDECVAVLRRAVELGVDLIDTADSYGPYVSEELIREALHPYGDVRIATKAGFLRTGPNAWRACGRPEYLRQECEMSLRRLGSGVARPLPAAPHRPERRAARTSSGCCADLLDEGKVRAVGLSEVSVDEIVAARDVVPISTVQNLYNVTNRTERRRCSTYCEREGIGFIPWYPGRGRASSREAAGRSTTLARARRVTSAQLSLAWLLAPLAGDAADPRHLQGRPPRGELRRGRRRRSTTRPFAALDALVA